MTLMRYLSVVAFASLFAIVSYAGPPKGRVVATAPVEIAFDTPGLDAGNGVSLGFSASATKIPLAVVFNVIEGFDPPAIYTELYDNFVSDCSFPLPKLNVPGQWTVPLSSTTCFPGSAWNGLNFYGSGQVFTAGRMKVYVLYWDSTL